MTREYVQLQAGASSLFRPPTVPIRGAEVAWLTIRVHYYADDFSHGRAPFELIGVFTGVDAEKSAVAACEQRYDLVMPAETNIVLPDATSGYYPLAGAGK